MKAREQQSGNGNAAPGASRDNPSQQRPADANRITATLTDHCLATWAMMSGFEASSMIPTSCQPHSVPRRSMGRNHNVLCHAALGHLRRGGGGHKRRAAQ